MKYFVSYTIRDKEITVDFLRKFSLYLQKKGEVYIDLIDNDSFNKQERVLTELEDSDVLILIETKSIYESKWVNIELKRAEFLKKEIRILSLDDIKRLIGINC